MICRSVTRLNLVTCIYLFWETDYNQLFKLISVTNCLNILLMIKLILPWILLPFPFSLIISSLCYMWFIFCDYFVSNMRNVPIFVIVWKKTKAFSSQKPNFLRFKCCRVKKVTLSYYGECSEFLAMFFPTWQWDSL